MYRAKIEHSHIKEGLLRVTVLFYSDQAADFIEIFETNQTQSDGWIEEHIQRKLAHINSLPDMLNDIEHGKEISMNELPAHLIIPEISAEKSDYKKDLDIFHKMVQVAQERLLSRDDANFIALRDKLKANFKMEYLDLF